MEVFLQGRILAIVTNIVLQPRVINQRTGIKHNKQYQIYTLPLFWKRLLLA